MNEGPDRPAVMSLEEWAVGAPAPDQGTAPTAEQVDEGDLDLLDPAWTPPRRVNRVTMVLAGGLLAALGFGGGVLIQKDHDAGLISSGSGAAAAARAFARNGVTGTGGGFAGFGDPSQGGAGELGSGSAGQGSGSAGQGSGSRGGTGSTGGSGSGTPVVVGKVVSVGPGTLVVENFAGTKVTVRVSATTSVTTKGLTGLRAGATVSVTGTKAADGSVTATTVVSRGNG